MNALDTHSKRYWMLAILGVCLLTNSVVYGQPTRCTLSGTVTNSVTSGAVAHALVSYSGLANGYRFTDSGGNFQVESVPCGDYFLDVSKPGFVSDQQTQPQVGLSAALSSGSESESTTSAPRPKQVPVTLNPDSSRVQIPLNPAASLAGMVVDENNEALVGLSVQAISIRPSLAGIDYVPVQAAHTDDRGHYTLQNLSPGEYLVRLAGEAAATTYFQSGTPNVDNDHRGVRPLYYPQAPSESTATVLNLSPGSEATADFHQTTEAAFDINGRLSQFVAQAYTQLFLYRDGDHLPVGRAYVNLATGAFRVVDVPPGSYTLRVEQYDGDRQQYLATEASVTVATEPIRDALISMQAAVDIPVSISYEEGAQIDVSLLLLLRPQHSRQNQRRLSILPQLKPEGSQTPIEGQGRSSPAQAPELGRPASPTSQASSPQQPMVFTNVVPDKYRLSAQLLDGGSSYVSAATLGNVDILHSEFSIGSASGEMRITVRGDSATVQGAVTFQGRPAPEAQVYLIPNDGDAAGVKRGFTVTEGRYQIEGVPPGSYRIRAWKGMPPAKELLAGGGDELTVQAREKRTLDLEAVSTQ
jgi:hypothetical protein